MRDISHIKNELEIAERASRLLPRRSAIYQTVIEQKVISADYIYRNFASTPKSSIRYDLQQLQKAGLIKKLGTTRGALYSAH